MIHQIADLSGRGLPIRFGDAATREGYEHEVRAALAKQQTRFAIAPRVRVMLPNGSGYLEAGAAVTVEMLGGGPLPPLLVLNRYLASGHIIEAEGFDDGPQAA